MDNKDNAVITKVENEIEIKLNDTELPVSLSDDWLEKKQLQDNNALSLEQVTVISEQIDNHYVASVVYKELERNLTERDKIVTEFKNKLVEAHDKGEAFVEQQNLLKVKIDNLFSKQKECLKEYQEGAQELEEEVVDIDKQISELEKQIIELQRRKSEIAEQQEIRLKEQDSTQLELQSEIDTLETNVVSLKKQHNDFEEQIKTMSAPEELAALDSKIEDLIHHICSIFEVPVVEDPANKQTQNNQTIPIFQLDPWATEENRGLAKISIPLGIKQIILSLHIPGDKVFDRYSAELYSSNGRRVWNSDKLDLNGRAVVITFNSTFFLSDDYEMRLRGRNTERSYTPIAEYYFHVNKK
jgi:chromosome segregation ATPase